MEKLDLRKAPLEEKEAIRIRCIRMRKQGKKTGEIVSALGVSPNSVRNWMKAYEQKGMRGLKETKRGVKKGAGRLLTEKQECQVQGWITDKMPEQLKLPFGLWTRKAIQELIISEFGIKIAIRTVGDYLHRWGFTPQKPKRKAYEQNPKAVQKWLNEEYPSIKRSAIKDNAEIHWGDETGVKNGCQYGRSYAPKGQTPIQTSMAKKLSLNMISTVTNQGMVRFMTYKGGMNSQMFIKFLNRLIKGSTKKIYLILDNLRVHHSKLVKEWVSRNEDQIALYYLPSYSPESNPDEYLNCDLKIGLSQKPSPKTEQDLKRNVNSHMKLLQRNPERVKKYFKHKSIKYAAA